MYVAPKGEDEGMDGGKWQTQKGVLGERGNIVRIISVKYNRRRPWKISQECVFNVDRYTFEGEWGERQRWHIVVAVKFLDMSVCYFPRNLSLHWRVSKVNQFLKMQIKRECF